MFIYLFIYFNFISNYIQNFNQHDIKFKNNAFALFLKDKDSFTISEEILSKLKYYSETFPKDEINYDLNGRVYTSHEGLLLKYEECFVKEYEGKFFDLSSHFQWIGKFIENEINFLLIFFL